MSVSPKNQSSSSPKWIRPVEVFSLRRKAKRNSSVLQPLDSNILANRFNSPAINQQNSNNFNPFRKFSQKRKIDIVQQENAESSQGFDELYTTERSSVPDTLPTIKIHKPWTPALFDETANSANLDAKEVPKPTPQRLNHLPLDWSLKMRLRFMSAKPFPFRGSLKTSEEASGTTSFTRCIHSTKVQECSVDTSANAKFHQQCLVWQQPSLPWLKLFPRIQETKGGQPSIFATNPSLQEHLLSDWGDSVRSLFQLVRARQCPFFYFCSNSFTILFRAGGVGGLPDVHALLTPTTSGIRKLLRAQGIEYTMPLCPKEADSSSDADVDLCPASETGTNLLPEEVEKDEEPEVFLESLGLSQQDFPSLNPKRRKLDQDTRDGVMETGPETLVCVESQDVQALLDFLLSSQGTSLCTSNTGPYAGVPPTLLSPCAFHGATLRTIKARQGWVKQGGKTMHCVDLSGPILPSMVHGLVTLFSETQDGNFSAVLASDTTTASFTSVSPDKSMTMASAFATENLKDSGLSSEFLLRLCSSPQRSVLHELDAENKFFSWS